MKANDIRVGNIIRYNDKLYRILKFQQVKPGKGGAFIQVEMKSVPDGTKEHKRFRSDETIDKPNMQSKEYTYLFSDVDTITLLDSENYEQIEIDKKYFDENTLKFINGDMQLSCLYCDGQLVECTLPKKVVAKITSCESHMKNQTATAVFKKATLENGYVLDVPSHIKEGDMVVIDTDGFIYIEIYKCL